MTDVSYYYLRNIFYEDNAAVYNTSKFFWGSLKIVVKLLRDLNRISSISVREIHNEEILIIDGLNQERIYKRKLDEFTSQACACYIGNKNSKLQDQKRFQINILCRNFYILLFIILKFILFRKRKNLLEIYYFLQKLIFSNFEKNFPNVKMLYFFNDRSYLNYLIISCAYTRNVRTCVYQHGYIANLSSYFPIHAHKFLSWGKHAFELAQLFNQEHKVKVNCRTFKDQELISHDLQIPNKDDCRVLIAVNYRANQLNRLPRIIRVLRDCNLSVTIKLHPSQKFKWITKIKTKLKSPGVEFVSKQMDDLVETFDVLITISSTSAFDFLLRGKPVIFLDDGPENMIPSFSYGFSIDDLMSNFALDQESLIEKNRSRISFLSYHLGNIVNDYID